MQKCSAHLSSRSVCTTANFGIYTDGVHVTIFSFGSGGSNRKLKWKVKEVTMFTSRNISHLIGQNGL